MNKVIIYTDGGCSPNPGLGGWGAVLISPAHGHKKELCGGELESTNNRMELMAAIRALEALKMPCEVDLHTDSKYVQNAFSKNWIGNWQRNNWRTASKQPVANQDLWQKLIELDKTHTINWCWVKGHSNNPYNERCHQLVWKAREEHKTNT